MNTISPHLFWSPSQFPQLANAQRIVALGESHACIVSNQVAMIVIRRPQPERTEHQKLPSRRLQQVRAAHNFGDAHSCIVDHDRELICRDIIAAPYDEVSEIAPRDHPLRPEVQISERDLLAVAHAKPPVHACRLGVFHCTCGDGRLGRLAKAKPSTPMHADRWTTPAGIHWLVIHVIRRSRRLRHVFSRANTRINHAEIPQLSPRFEIVPPPLTLGIGTSWSAAVRAFDPLDAQPSQIFEHRLHKLRPAALRIQIFVAED